MHNTRSFHSGSEKNSQNQNVIIEAQTCLICTVEIKFVKREMQYLVSVTLSYPVGFPKVGLF